MADGCFTPRSARQALDSLRPTAESMCRLVRELERHRPKQILPDQPVDPDYFILVSRLQAALGKIRRRGVKVKDLRKGLLDFPARLAGRAVLLCWHVGEESLGFWHEPGQGFAGRQPVDEDGPWDEA